MHLLRYRDLIWTLVLRDLKVRYRRSAIGFLWTMLQPLLTMLVMQLVFSQLFRLELRSGSYPVYVLSGILFWNFFSQSIVSSMNSLRANAAILQKLPVPTAIFPVTTVLSGIVNLVFAFVPLFAILLVTRQPIGPAMFFLPVSILIVAMFTLGAGLLLSPLSVLFSDVIELVGVALMLLFYLTPVIYPKEIVEGASWYWVIHYNPTRSILEIFRDPIFFNKIPPLSHLSLSLVLAVGALAVGAFAFRKMSDRIPYFI